MRPPRVFQLLLELVLRSYPGRSAVLGDLHEEFRARTHRGENVRARLWYAAHATGLAMSYIFSPRTWSRWFGGGLVMDVRLACRSLRLNPGYTFVGLLSIVIGLGANVSLFSVINPILVRPLPYPEPHNILDIGEFNPAEVCEGCGVSASYATYEHLRDEARSFELVGVSDMPQVTLRSGDVVRQLRQAQATESFYRILGMPTQLGRPITDDDGPNTVVLSHRLWQGLFGGDLDILGRVLTLDDRRVSVVGVAHADFGFLVQADLFGGLDLADQSRDPGERSFWMLGRVAEGATLDDAHAELAVLSRGLQAAFPEAMAGWSVIAQPIRDVLLNEIGDPTVAVLFLIAGSAVLLIACANLGSIAVSRGWRRRQELGIRAALGASRGRLYRQLATESGVLVVLGLSMALALSHWIMSTVERQFGAFLPGWIDFSLDWRVFVVSLGFALIALCVAGAIPAVTTMRMDPNAALQGGARGATAGPNRMRSQAVLVTGQIALGLALMTSAALAMRGYHRVSRLDNLGYEPRGVQVVSYALEGSAYDMPEARHNTVMELRGVLAPLGAKGAVAAEAQRFLGTFGPRMSPSVLSASDHAEPVTNAFVPRHSLAVTPGYFDLMRIDLLHGRAFLSSDVMGSEGVAIVNEQAAQLLWPGQTALGKELYVDDQHNVGWMTVVGVVASTVISPLQESRTGHSRIYFPYAQSSSRSVRLLLRSQEPLSQVEIEQRTRAVDSNVMVTSVMTVEDELRRWVGGTRIMMILMAGLAGLALTLTAVGFYGLFNYAVSIRTREWSIRMALGASVRSIGGNLVKSMGPVVGIGIVLGLLVSIALVQLGSAAGVRLGSNDPIVLLASILGVMVLCVVASWSPFRRATATDPVSVLRDES